MMTRTVRKSDLSLAVVESAVVERLQKRVMEELRKTSARVPHRVDDIVVFRRLMRAELDRSSTSS